MGTEYRLFFSWTSCIVHTRWYKMTQSSLSSLPLSTRCFESHRQVSGLPWIVFSCSIQLSRGTLSHTQSSFRLSSTLLLHVQYRYRLDSSSITKNNTPYKDNEDLDGYLVSTNQTIHGHQAHGQPPRGTPVHVKTWTYQYARTAAAS